MGFKDLCAETVSTDIGALPPNMTVGYLIPFLKSWFIAIIMHETIVVARNTIIKWEILSFLFVVRKSLCPSYL